MNTKYLIMIVHIVVHRNFLFWPQALKRKPGPDIKLVQQTWKSGCLTGGTKKELDWHTKSQMKQKQVQIQNIIHFVHFGICWLSSKHIQLISWKLLTGCIIITIHCICPSLDDPKLTWKYFGHDTIDLSSLIYCWQKLEVSSTFVRAFWWGIEMQFFSVISLGFLAFKKGIT